MENILFYDIESLKRLFSLAAYSVEKDPSKNQRPKVDIYYLYDPDGSGCVRLSPESEAYVRYKVFSENPNLAKNARVDFYNLLDEAACLRLAETFGCVADGLTVKKPILWDTDPGYDPEKHPFLAGYNILNYDMVMLGSYFSGVSGINITETRRKPNMTGTLFVSGAGTSSTKAGIPGRLQNWPMIIWPCPDATWM